MRVSVLQEFLHKYNNYNRDLHEMCRTGAMLMTICQTFWNIGNPPVSRRHSSVCAKFINSFQSASNEQDLILAIVLKSDAKSRSLVHPILSQNQYCQSAGVFAKQLLLSPSICLAQKSHSTLCSQKGWSGDQLFPCVDWQTEILSSWWSFLLVSRVSPAARI